MDIREAWKIKLSVLDKRIEAFSQGYRQNIAILGNDEEELLYLLDNYFRLKKYKDVICIHTTTVYVEQRDFLKSVIFFLLSSYINKREDSLDNLINYTTEILPNTAELIKNILKKNTFTFLNVLEIINQFINESDKQCVFIVEEFTRIKELFPNVYNDFAQFIILQRKCMVVLTTSCHKEAQNILSNELNLLFGNFENIYLEENIFLELYLYLKQTFVTIFPSPLFLSFWINIVGNNILYYDVMRQFIKDNYCASSTVEGKSFGEDEAIISTLEKAIYSKETYFFQKFINKIKFLEEKFKDAPLLFKLLISLSEGYIRKRELASLNILEIKELDNKLEKLAELNYIEKSGTVYKVKDRLFSFWLASVFKLYLSPPIVDSQTRYSLWKKKIEEEIMLFKEDFLKEKIKRVFELISSFQDDILQVGKDKYKLPPIDKIKLIAYPEKNFHLLVAEGKEIIFAGIKEKSVEDSDIFEFIERGSSFHTKKIKKIFISLDNLSPSARLIAKNNKLIIWDVNQMNQLFRLYNKPVISYL